MVGRKQDDIIWQYYIKKRESNKSGCRAICKNCNKEIQRLVQRLKAHYEICNGHGSNSTAGSQVLLNSFSSTSTDLSDSNCIRSRTSRSKSPETTSASEPVTTTSKSSSCSRSPVLSNSEPLNKKKKNDSQPSVSGFLVRTFASEKQKIDKQIAKAIYATNSSFRCIENLHVKKAIQLLRPGYTPPSRKTIGTTLLDEIYIEEKEKCFSSLSGQCLNMSIDGWSNVHNEPVICATITTEDRKAFLYDTIDTSGKPHTSEYLTEICGDLITTCESTYQCNVRSFVTDNAANMACMRKAIMKKTKLKVITYGCSAHLLNLLCKDLEIKDIKEHVVQIVKYFRNNHLARAKFKQAGGKALVLPSDVRWNSAADCLEMYVTQWELILKICDESNKEIDATIYQKVSNIGLKRTAEDYLNLLKPVSVALDTLQKKDTTLSAAVEQWKHLQHIFDEELELTLQQTEAFESRYEQALTPYHLIAYMLDPTKQKYKLTDEEMDVALETIKDMYGNTGLLPLVIKFNARSAPFKKIMFSEKITSNVSGLDWWLSQRDQPEIAKQLQTIKQFLCAIASSASVERVFSTFGFVHSDIRNKLGVEKALQ